MEVSSRRDIPRECDGRVGHDSHSWSQNGLLAFLRAFYDPSLLFWGTAPLFQVWHLTELPSADSQSAASAFVIWFLERDYQPTEFPRSFFKGLNESSWV